MYTIAKQFVLSRNELADTNVTVGYRFCQFAKLSSCATVELLKRKISFCRRTATLRCSKVIFLRFKVRFAANLIV